MYLRLYRKEGPSAPSGSRVLSQSGTHEIKLDLSSKLLHLTRSRKTLSEVASEETFGKPLVPKKVEEP